MKDSTKTLTTVAVLAAISIALAYLVRFPIFPSASYLEYEPADMPVIIGAFLYGPLWGSLLTLLVSALQALTVSSGSGIIGFLMHLLATGGYMLVSCAIYRHKKSAAGAALGLTAGTLAAVALMIPLNLIFTPLFGVPVDAVKEMLLPVIIPFNLIKFGVNSALAFVLHRSVVKFTRGQV